MSTLGCHFTHERIFERQVFVYILPWQHFECCKGMGERQAAITLRNFLQRDCNNSLACKLPGLLCVEQQQDFLHEPHHCSKF